jgi:copper chaperone CopZ
MKSLKFKTNIKCQGCINTVKADMDQLAGASHWSVDLNNPDRILTVENPDVIPQEVVSALAKTSYQATLVEG